MKVGMRMNDLIERQVAENAICNACGKIDCDQMDTCEKLKLPPAQPEKRTEEHTETHACDLISRQAAIDAHYEYCNKHPDAGFPVWSLKILEDLPPAQPDMSGYSDKLWKKAYERGKAEAQDEIVWCKDCKHQIKEWRTDKRLKDKGYMVCGCEVVGDACGYWALLGQDDDYCSMAERRTDG